MVRSCWQRASPSRRQASRMSWISLPLHLSPAAVFAKREVSPQRRQSKWRSTDARPVYRDIAALQGQLGATLVCDKDDGEVGTGRWKMMEGSRFRTPVEFTPSELLSLLAAMSLMQPLLETPYGAGLKTLQGKVRGRLSDSAIHFLEEDAALAVAAGARSDFRRHAATIDVLRRGIREKRTIKMRYTSLHGGAKETRRKLDPYKLWYAEGVLYVVGGCHVHGKEARTFAVDRVRDASVTEAKFALPP